MEADGNPEDASTAENAEEPEGLSPYDADCG